MSWHETPTASTEHSVADSIELIVVPRTRDLGGFEVARILPSAQRRLVGPFIFLDRMGPSRFEVGHGMDVRPHPHIGLATMTYLFEGEIMHRDSLGTEQPIQPGAVNWMTAGRGITHSERSPEVMRAAGSKLFGMQAWIALPKAVEESAPDFVHYPKNHLPAVEDDGIKARVLAGSFGGIKSPLVTASGTLYVDIELTPGARCPIETTYEERALFIVEGEIELDGHAHPAGELLVLKPESPLTVHSMTKSRVMLLGGDPMDGPRHIWWNFVSSSKERIEQAKADWRAKRFDAVPGDDEFIPLPDQPGP